MFFWTNHFSKLVCGVLNGLFRGWKTILLFYFNWLSFLGLPQNFIYFYKYFSEAYYKCENQIMDEIRTLVFLKHIRNDFILLCANRVKLQCKCTKFMLLMYLIQFLFLFFLTYCLSNF